MAPHLTRFMEWIKPFQDPTDQIAQSSRLADFRVCRRQHARRRLTTWPRPANTMKTCSLLPKYFRYWDKRSKARIICDRRSRSKTGINAHLFNGEYYLARTDTNKMFPLASAWALRFDIEPAADKSKILAAIEQAGKPDIGGYGGDALYSGLFNARRRGFCRARP